MLLHLMQAMQRAGNEPAGWVAAQVFSQGAAFDYGVTLSDAVDMPINLGMQFVLAGRYRNAIAFLDDVIAVYPFNETFIAGQVGLQLRACGHWATRRRCDVGEMTCSASGGCNLPTSQPTLHLIYI